MPGASAAAAARPRELADEGVHRLGDTFEPNS